MGDFVGKQNRGNVVALVSAVYAGTFVAPNCGAPPEESQKNQ
jgi:hypothetical protein